MRKISLVCLFALLALAAVMAFAADVNGKWVAQVPGRGGETRDVTFNFKADGDQLTGTVTTPRGDSEISDGKINGDEISFTQVLEFNGNQMKLKYTGKVSGDEIKFTRQAKGRPRAQEFTAKRAS
jgi:hypothetical protein